jgi:hypothetical protein
LNRDGAAQAAPLGRRAGSEDVTSVDDRATDQRRWLLAGAVLVLALVPFLFMGPGTDLDAGAVIRSGRTIVDDFTYTPSRAPGAPVHETGVGILHAIAGTAGSNLGSLLAAIGCVAALVALLRREGVPRAGLVTAVVVVNPWFLIAATSTVDFLWALALLLAAAWCLRSDRAVLAGVAAALAIGCRSSTVALVICLVVSELVESRAGARRRALIASAIAAAGAVLIFIPAFRSSGDSLAFAQNDVPTSSFLVQAGRFATKDLYLVGPFAAVVLIACIPSLAAVLTRVRVDWLVRFAALGLLVSQVLFLRFPWKMGHLLPSLVFLAILLGVSFGSRPRWLIALVVAQLLYVVVNIQLVRPDVPNAATTGRLTFDPAWGALVVDTQCRRDDEGAWKSRDQARIDAVWNCAKPWAR